MFVQTVARVTGAAAVISGLALCAASYVESTLPVGCVGDQCDVRPQRPSSQTADLCYLVAFALLVVAALGLGVMVMRSRGLGRLGRVAVGLIASGAVVAVLANVVQTRFYGGDMAAMPAVFLPAVGAVVVGFVLLMVVVIRARIVPLWAGLLVGLTVLLVPFGNQENTTVLLDLPFGLALALAGVLILRQTEATAPHRNRGRRAHVEGA
ncbi:hypothetical protein [Nocardioides cynanchi]|uniref:hypothetical protein n=1 Tax=Nocardioides cynanchi TaxID=2558918 RepID=UPI001245A0F0|nr:hypothetical protein [Nocardioides cynanchi]